VQGFGGDTMHMARLVHSSRGPGEYSLARTSHHYSTTVTKVKKKLMNLLAEQYKKNPDVMNTLKEYHKLGSVKVKKSMEELFAKPKVLKTGALSKVVVQPEIEELHTNPEYVKDWVNYSVLDAELTFFLREALITELSAFPVKSEDMSNLWEFYLKYWLPLGECLTDMEREGMLMDMDHLKAIEEQAKNDKFVFLNEFMSWVISLDAGLRNFNPSSTAHMQQLLFGPFDKEYSSESSESDAEEDEDSPRRTMNMSLKNQTSFPQTRTFVVDNPDRDELSPRLTHLTVTGLGLEPVGRTVTGMPSVDAKALKMLAGDPKNGKYGKAYEHFVNLGEEEKGKECCYALNSLVQYKSIETLINSFILPLQKLVDRNSRLHYSLNINTETGRLSAKKPNAQNQPALDKDKYKIRKAFHAGEGKSLIVADYGQLELRVLAHMTNCASMLDAFRSGGDFHSRTAMGMYPEIKQAVDEGRVLLEWDSSQGTAPAPLLKNIYAAERKKAKTMNFSIAYGKTAHGFAKDWGCSYEEAAASLKRWYSDRKEVETWQESVRNLAVTKGYTKTLLGRYRRLTDLVRHKQSSKRQHGLRAAINTPIQGGAADIVTAAMIRLNYDLVLKQMGWKMLLQIHDEVIMEGPTESSKEALERVRFIMEHPLDNDLRLSLEADAKIAKTWYEAK
jgi:DNA polymerase-1